MEANKIHLLLIFIGSIVSQVYCHGKISQKFFNGFSKAQRFNMSEAENFCHSFSANLPEVSEEDDVINMKILFSMHVSRILLGHIYDKKRGWINPSRDNEPNEYLNGLLSKESVTPHTCIILNLKPNGGKWRLELGDCSISTVEIAVCSIYERTKYDLMVEKVKHMPDLTTLALIISIFSFISALIGVITAMFIRMALTRMYVKMFLSGSYRLPLNTINSEPSSSSSSETIET